MFSSIRSDVLKAIHLAADIPQHAGSERKPPGVVLANPTAGFFETDVSLTYEARHHQIIVKAIRVQTGEVVWQRPQEAIIALRNTVRDALQAQGRDQVV